MDLITASYKDIILFIFKFVFKRLKRFFIFVWTNKLYWFYRNKISILYESDPASSKKFCVFALYQPTGIPPYLFKYLKELQEIGFSIFVISTCTLECKDVEKLKPLCFKIGVRPNQGQDFGSYKMGINDLLKHYYVEELLIANDSVIGPFAPLAPIYQRLTKSRPDVWGMSDAYYTSYHIGSFFMVFSKKILSHPQFIHFWKLYKVYNSRNYAIKHGEIALNQLLIALGAKTAPAFPLQEILTDEVWRPTHWSLFLENIGVLYPKQFKEIEAAPSRFVLRSLVWRLAFKTHPLHIFWNIYIKKGYPFIKKDTIRKLKIDKKYLDNLSDPNN